MLPTFREWVLDVDMGVLQTASTWDAGIDILPLLTHTAQAQRVQTKPKFGVKLRNSTRMSGRFFTYYLDAVFRPDTATVPKREYLLASVEAMLVHKSPHKSYEHLVLVLKDGVGPIGTQVARQKLMRSFGFVKGFDKYVCLGYYNAAGNVVGLVDVQVDGPLAKKAQLKQGGPGRR